MIITIITTMSDITYQIETHHQLWSAFKQLVGEGPRCTDRVEVLIAIDVLNHRSLVSTPGVEAAKTVLQNSELDRADEFQQMEREIEQLRSELEFERERRQELEEIVDGQEVAHGSEP